jgi:hypothetical protein
MNDERLCLVKIDCLSRGAAFDEAHQLIRDYESQHAPSLAMHSKCCANTFSI